MLRGKTEAETLALNGWTVGDILESPDDDIFVQAIITAIGRQGILLSRKYSDESDFGPDNDYCPLFLNREWRKVGRVES